MTADPTMPMGVPPWQRTFLPEAPSTAPPVDDTPFWVTPPTPASSGPALDRFPPPTGPAYGAAPYGAPAAGGQSPAAAGYSIPVGALPASVPKSVVTAGRWGRARGILGAFVNGLVVMLCFLAPNSRTFSTDLLFWSLGLLAFYLVWLYAGQQTVHGDRAAAKLLRVLAFADVGAVALFLALGVTATWQGGLLGIVLDLYLIRVLLGSEAVRWFAGRR